MIECKYGHFSADGKEYVITNPYTPRPWINSMSNGDYSLLASQMGGGFSYRINAEQNRLTRYYQDLIKDNWGRYFYVRDKEQGDFWSCALMPIQTPCDSYTVRHGIGYTVYERLTRGILSSMTVFVSADKPMDFAVIRLTNKRKTPAVLDLTGYFEFAPGMAYDTHREFHKLFSTLSFDSKLNSILLTKCLWGFPDKKGRGNNDNWPYTAFFGCSDKIDSYDCDKESFIGMYRDEKNPAAFDQEHLTNSRGRYGDPVGGLRTQTLILAPEQTTETVFAIGMAKDETESVPELLARCNPSAAAKELDAVGKMWQKLIFDSEWVDTPDTAFNLMTNIWSKYQAISGRMWAKAGYYQISGGIGYRDQLQDSLVMLENNPEYTKRQILLHASHQFHEGDVQHWWLQLGNVGARSMCSDDFLWLVFAVLRYLRETGDFDILNLDIPFVNGGSAILYEHCVRAVKLSLSRFSPRGIPLMGDHDWNDGLSAVGNGMKGESFWVAEFLYQIMCEFAPVAQSQNDGDFAELLKSRAAQLKKDFNACAWDGEWFLQATNDLGDKIGSVECDEGKIFLNPQIWAVISDITDQERKNTAMQSVSKHLLKKYGALLLSPEYKSPNENIGYITRYAPGLRENGGVYTHAACWAVWAYAMAGDAENAYEAYRRICPPNRSNDIDVYYSEPYVLCGNSDGPVSPHYGRGGWSWYTGSAQWLHGVAVWWILGVRPTMDGLSIDPCIPNEWSGYTYRRTYRGGVYDIVVKAHSGKKEMLLDGKRIEGNVLPIVKGVHKVEVYI